MVCWGYYICLVSNIAPTLTYYIMHVTLSPLHIYITPADLPYPPHILVCLISIATSLSHTLLLFLHSVQNKIFFKFFFLLHEEKFGYKIRWISSCHLYYTHRLYYNSIAYLCWFQFKWNIPFQWGWGDQWPDTERFLHVPRHALEGTLSGR